MLDNIISKYNILLWPLSILYGMGVCFRNQLFKWKILKSKSYPVPVICVGNLAVGGTGKTPHIEYLIRLLKDRYKVAVVSRGYKRTSKGFLLATSSHSYNEIGDEPFQIRQKFPDILVAIDSNRQRAIENLLSMSEEKRPEVILLDDAFQHRYVKPSFSILLTDYNRMYYNDFLLPSGRLREPIAARERADMVIVTKTPDDLKPIEYRITETNMKLQANQSVFFSSIGYDRIRPIFPSDRNKFIDQNGIDHILLVSGIASPKPFIDEVKKFGCPIEKLIFSDHHDFNESDMKKINQSFARLKGDNRIILTTEKDAARILNNKYLPEDLRRYCFFLPMHIVFSDESKDVFNNIILKHIDTFSK